MVLFLSSSFLRRIKLIWKPDLKAFLIGQRNLFFFAPDIALETEDLSPEAIDRLLAEGQFEENWELLGFLAPDGLPSLPGYAIVDTGSFPETEDWKAGVYLSTDQGLELRTLEIKQTKTG